MACEFCRMSPHHPRCPEASELKIVHYCSECKEPIHEGDTFYPIGERKYCRDCVHDCRSVAEIEDLDWDD